MNLTYKVEGNGYTILLNGTPWIVQKDYIPYKGRTVEESAQNHINAILKQKIETEEQTKMPTLDERVKALEEVQLTAMGV